MSSPVDAAQAWVNEYQARFGAQPGVQETQAELERCVELAKQLLQQRDDLRLELAHVQKEREEYLQALYALTHKDFAIDKARALALFGKQPPLAELLAELEAQGEVG